MNLLQSSRDVSRRQQWQTQDRANNNNAIMGVAKGGGVLGPPQSNPTEKKLLRIKRVRMHYTFGE